MRWPCLALIAEYLSSNLTIRVRTVDVAEVMDLPESAPMAAEDQWRLFHVLGAGLRLEAKTL